MIALLMTLQALAAPGCSTTIVVNNDKAEFSHGKYPTLWQQDVNGDGKVDLFTMTDNCGERACQAGLYLNCGDGKYRQLIAPDHEQETIHVTRGEYNGWKVLGQKKTKRHQSDEQLGVEVDVYDDLNDALSQERLFLENKVFAHYNSSGKGSPADLNGQLVFINGKYQQVYREGEIKYMMELVELGDHQAALILFYDVLKSPLKFPPYAKAKKLIMQKEFLRSLFKTGFSALPRDVDHRLLADAETERYFIRANVANIDPDYLQDRMREDHLLKNAVLKYSADNIAYMPRFIQSDQVNAEIALGENRRAIEFVLPEFLGDSSLIQRWCKDYKISVRFSSRTVLNNHETAKKCIEARAINYQFFSEALRSDRDLARLALGQDGYLIAFAPKSIKNDLELASLALKNYPEAKRFLPRNVLKRLRVRQEP